MTKRSKPYPTTVPRKTLWSCVLGHGLEMYDFTLYGTFTTVIADHFFKATSFWPALLALSVGYLARPLGALLFGWVSDIYGRKTSLIFTILISSVATGVIGLCPSYALIGVFSSVLLCIARFAQGLCAGAETSDASVFLIENCPLEQTTYGSAVIFLSGSMGCLVALCMGQVFIALTAPWAWRVPFLLGCGAGAFILYLRVQVKESAAFTHKLKDSTKRPVMSFITHTIRQYPSPVFQAVCCGLLSGITSTTLVVFSNLYLHKILGIAMGSALFFSVFGMLPFMMSCFLCRRVSSRAARNKIVRGAVAGILFFSGPYFFLLQTGFPPVICAAQMLFGMLAGSFIAPINALLAEFFPVEVRCTGISVGYNTGYAFTSGLYPLLAFYLIEVTGCLYMPSLFPFFFAALALYVIYIRHKKTSIIPLYAKSVS